MVCIVRYEKEPELFARSKNIYTHSVLRIHIHTLNNKSKFFSSTYTILSYIHIHTCSWYIIRWKEQRLRWRHTKHKKRLLFTFCTHNTRRTHMYDTTCKQTHAKRVRMVFGFVFTSYLHRRVTLRFVCKSTKNESTSQWTTRTRKRMGNGQKLKPPIFQKKEKLNF